MTNHQNLQNSIRLSIQGMVANNDDHNFEKMCYEYSLSNICKNTVMPTGGGCGDKGRDFYTIPIYMNGIKTKDIAFLCSLNKKIRDKIKSDINNLNENFPEIKDAYFFAGVDIAESHRYNLVQYAKNMYDINLEIVDLNQLSQLLCSIDNFNIVENYLHISSSLYPKPQEENWYRLLKQKYQNSIIISYEDFREVVAAIRETTSCSTLRLDAKFWIERLECFLENSTDFYLKSRTLYEIAHSYLRGLNNLDTFKQKFITYVNLYEKTENIIILEDAVCLINYAIGTIPHGVVYPENLIQDFNDNISNMLDKLLEIPNNINKARLLFLKILLSMKTVILKEHNIDPRYFTDQIDNLLMELEEHPFFSATKVDETLKILLHNSVRDNFKISKEKAIEIQDRIDSLISKQEGEGILGERIRDRMINYVDNKDYLSAIKEGHKLKKAWKQQDSYYGCILSLAILAFCYEKIGLHYAAKYYYLISIRMCIHSDNPYLFSKAMHPIYSLAKLDYLLGNWYSFFKLLDIYFTIYYLTERKGFDLKDSESQELIYYSCIIKKTASFEPDYDRCINDIIKNLNCDDDLKRNILVDLQQENHYHVLDKLWKELQNNIKQRPFSDMNEDNNITFNTSGIEWHFVYKNINKNRIIVEEFIAIIQILLAEMHGLDIMHLQTKIVLNIFEYNMDNFNLEEIANNDYFEYKLFIPNFKSKLNINSFIPQILSCCFTIIEKCSLLEQVSMYEILENLFKHNLIEKLCFFSSYRNSYSNLYELKEDNKNLILKVFNIANEYKIQDSCIDIFIYDKLSILFDEIKIKEILQKRYENSLEFIKPTLKLLCSKEKFTKMINEYKNLGYLDWELLMAISNMLMDYKATEILNNSPLILTEEQKFDLYHKLAIEISKNRTKYNTPPKDLNIFLNKALFEMQLKMNYTLELQRLGLHLKTQTPKFNAIKEFLNKRFLYNVIDVEHSSII